jgi:folate-binding protein YgfZ
VTELPLHRFHQDLNATFTAIHGAEVVDHYGDPLAEHTALRSSAGVVDLSFRSRLCLTGADRQRFLNGQVTNNVKDLKVGAGCYAALVTAKGKLESDLNVYCLADELLLDFEPGLSAKVASRFEKFIIADDVEVIDVAPHHGLLTLQGPKSWEVIDNTGLGLQLPAIPMNFTAATFLDVGEVYCMKQPRGATEGFDLFVPTAALGDVFDKLLGAARNIGGRPCGCQALEMIRIEAGIPRFGADMDETNLAPEAGIDERAISYSKGCYIGQEVIARIRTYGQVAKSLRGLRLPDDLKELPKRGDKLFHNDREVGYVTSALASPVFQRNIALGYVRREHSVPGVVLKLHIPSAELSVKVIPLPFSEANLC